MASYTEGKPYYDKEGKPLNLIEWAKLLEDKAYKVIRQTHTPNGYYISTVWLGLDHSFGSGPPLIFETMVFKDGSWSELSCIRSSTMDHAIQDHYDAIAEFDTKEPTNEN